MTFVFTSRCPACDGATAARGDLLCPNCWKRVPRPLVELYRLMHRLHQAGLAASDGLKEFARLIAREAGRTHDRADGAAPRTERAAVSAPASKPTRQSRAPVAIANRSSPPSVGGKPRESTRLRLAQLPTCAADAISARDLAERTQEPRHPVDVWCSWGRREGTIPGLRWVEVTPGRFAYWRAP